MSSSGSRWRVSGPLILVGLLAVGVIAARRSHELADTAVVVSSAPAGPAIPAGFVGVSLEYPAVAAYAVSQPGRAGPALAPLIQRLAPGQSPVIRIGGDTTDTTWWPSPGLRRPAGVTLSLSSGWIEALRRLALATHARLIMGIDLEANRPALAAAEARALLAGLGRARLEAFELGNEAARYRAFPWYHTRARVPVFARASNYGPQAFMRQFTAFARGLPGSVPLAGPTVAGPDWMRYLPRFLVSAPRLGLVTYHRYPLDRCFTPRGSPRYPTIGRLLSTAASRGMLTGLAGYVATARRRGLSLRVDELNSVACGGKNGVSNVFAAALWSLDTLFAIARAGAVGVNVHNFPAAAYSLFSLRRGGSSWQVSLRPEYYGLELFANAAPPGSRLLPARSSNLAEVRVWATLARDGTTRVLIINDDTQRRHVVAVTQPLRSGTATLQLLTAPSANATRGVKLSAPSPLASESSGLYRVALPAASAALLTISR